MDDALPDVLLRLQGRYYRLLPPHTTGACFQRVRFATLAEYHAFLQPLAHDLYYRHIFTWRWDV